MNRTSPNGPHHEHLLDHSRRCLKRGFVAQTVRTALLIALSLTAIGFADLPATYAQPAPPIPTDQNTAPLSGPQPRLPFPPGFTSPLATPTPGTPPLLPTATATPIPAPKETLVPQTPLAYRIQGNLTLTTQSQGSFPVTQRRGFEVIVMPPGVGEDMTTIRRLRLWPTDESSDVLAVTAYERDSAAMTVIGEDTWSIHAHNRQSPLARALRPVLDAGALAYEACARSSSGEQAAGGDADGACTLEDEGDVAEFLTRQNPGLRVNSSTLVAELNPVDQHVQRLVLTAELTPVLDAGTSYRIEWTYTVDALDEGDDDIASRTFEWSAVGPRIEESDVPGFSGGSLPSAERILGIERDGDTMRVLFSLSQAEAIETVRAALRAGGWNVQDSGSALVARHENQVVVVFANGSAATTEVDVVRIQ